MILNRILRLRLIFVGIISLAPMLIIFTSHAADPTSNQTKQDYYLRELTVERSESYLESILRKYRSFPHLDKAYRLMDENKKKRKKGKKRLYAKKTGERK